ncbi:phosphatase PAP2 family protein [Streptomyces sp. TG1A-8]|uniref:phosphatase PAP2 family protein n=1 Tax=Streptomyces sp. TG1A-8 TaxID=3051385 RepID=UPI00265C4AF0|nr:phosphatase PAP2 family protein [Streptomyces sp. TG1A-8]MDO0924486.1 phosphatase PAP2 family protein [Streptomyces sp. TG1A-8]
MAAPPPAPGDRRGIAELAGSVALGAWAAFGVLAMAVLGGRSAPPGVDLGLLSWSVGHRPRTAVAAARALTATGTGAVPYALVVLAGLLVGRTGRQRRTTALLAAGCLATGQAARYGTMELAARARPPHPDWRTHASGWSFPSGHTTTAALAAGLVIVALCLRAPRGRGLLCAATAGWGAGVGLTRVFLGVHWFTDVLGGWLFAAGWLGLWLCATARWLPTGPPAGAGAPDTAGTPSPERPRAERTAAPGAGARRASRPDARRSTARRPAPLPARRTAAPSSG